MNNDKKLKINICFQELQENQDFVESRTDLPDTKEYKPKCAFPGPYIRQVEKDVDYFYCTCGYSKTQPLCDGSHIEQNKNQPNKDLHYKPMKFRHNKHISLNSICGCKYNDKT